MSASEQAYADVPRWRRIFPTPAAGLAYGAVAAVAVAVALSQSATVEQRLLLAAIALVVLAPTALEIAARRFDYFSPQTIFAAAWGMMFLARPVAMLYENNFSLAIANSPAQDVRAGFSTMLLAALLGAIAFQVGYFLRRPAVSSPSRRVDWDHPLILRFAVALGALGTLLFAAFVLHSGIHQAIEAFVHGRSAAQAALYKSSSAYLYDGILVLIPATLLLVGRLAFGGADRRRLTLALSWVFGALLVMRALMSGGRTPLLLLLGALAVFYFLRRGTRPRLAWVAVFLVIAFVALSILRATRDPVLRRQSGLGGTIAAVFEHPGHQVGKLLNGGDTSMASVVALETEIVPSQLDYRYGGATFGDLVIRPIPHQIWKRKPLAPEAALTQQLWPKAFKAGLAHPVYTVMGTFYFDFGLFGVFAGMLVVGLIYGVVRSRLLGVRDTGLVLVTAAVIPLLVVGLRDSFPDTVRNVVVVVVPLVVALEFVRRRAGLPPTDAAAEPTPQPS